MTVKEYETKGRQKLLEDFNNAECEIQYEFTNERYDSVDCYATACTGQRYAIEIKNRDISIDDYDEVLLEEHKYKVLMKIYKDSGYTPVYRCYYKDGKLSWDLTKIHVNVTEMPCAESTKNYNHKVKKKIIMLKKEDALGAKHDDKNRGNIVNS